MAGKYFSSTLWSIVTGLSLMIPPAVLAQAERSAGSAQNDPVAIYSQAGATPEQIEKIRALGKESDEHRRVNFQLLMNLRKQMQELSLQLDPDEKTVIAKQEEINKVISDSATHHIKLMLKIREILTPEQKRNLTELIKLREQARAGAASGGESAAKP